MNETREIKSPDNIKPEQFDVEAVNRRDKQQVLYAAREKIHPKRAKGTFRNFKWLMMIFTLGVYYLTPWLRWDRGEFSPDQAVLVDMANRRFYFFFIEIWPQEFFYVAGMLVMAGVALFLVTSTVGRAWCGYSCPQTIWVDLFLVVERLFEGERNSRIKLDAAPWTASKIIKRSSKHVVWILISIATGGAWIFYFADAPTLAVDFILGEAAFVAYGTVAVLAAFTYTFGGMMREQVCTYMCPWPRIQAAMLDENSLTVTYNDWRGEPRSRHAKKLKKQGKPIGDCVDCNACVAVCPMGIDIRDGQQLECITCALCIDACDGVMNKLGLEKGLISYTTLSDYNKNTSMDLSVSSNAKLGEIDVTRVRDKSGKMFDKFLHTDWRTLVRPRTIIYSLVYGAIGISLIGLLLTRDRLELNVIHDRNPTFVVLSDGSIRNGYEIKILNMLPKPRTFKLEFSGLEGGQLKLAGSNELGTSTIISAKADQLHAVKIFIQVPKNKVKQQNTSFKLQISDIMEGGEQTEYKANFVAPDGN